MNTEIKNYLNDTKTLIESRSLTIKDLKNQIYIQLIAKNELMKECMESSAIKQSISRKIESAPYSRDDSLRNKYLVAKKTADDNCLKISIHLSKINSEISNLQSALHYHRTGFGMINLMYSLIKNYHKDSIRRSILFKHNKRIWKHLHGNPAFSNLTKKYTFGDTSLDLSGEF
jgi:hypothetical protein